MINSINNQLEVHRQKLTNISLVLIFTTFGVVLDFIPKIAWQTGGLNFNTVAFAQNNISESDLQKYAQTLVEIEQIRQPALTNIVNIIGKEAQTTPLACNQPENLSKLPDKARDIAKNYCTESEAIVKKNGLSISQFNQITRNIQDNPSLQQKIQEIIRQM